MTTLIHLRKPETWESFFTLVPPSLLIADPSPAFSVPTPACFLNSSTSFQVSWQCPSPAEYHLWPAQPLSSLLTGFSASSPGLLQPAHPPHRGQSHVLREGSRPHPHQGTAHLSSLISRYRPPPRPIKPSFQCTKLKPPSKPTQENLICLECPSLTLHGIPSGLSCYFSSQALSQSLALTSYLEGSSFPQPLLVSQNPVFFLHNVSQFVIIFYLCLLLFMSLPY